MTKKQWKIGPLEYSFVIRSQSETANSEYNNPIQTKPAEVRFPKTIPKTIIAEDDLIKVISYFTCTISWRQLHIDKHATQVAEAIACKIKTVRIPQESCKENDFMKNSNASPQIQNNDAINTHFVCGLENFMT